MLVSCMLTLEVVGLWIGEVMNVVLDDALQDVCAPLLIDHLDLSHVTLSCSPSTLDEEQLISSGRHERSLQQAIANFP